jgi:hypothetical protein
MNGQPVVKIKLFVSRTLNFYIKASNESAHVEMLPLETKLSGGKLLPHSDLRGGGGSVSRGSITQP